MANDTFERIERLLDSGERRIARVFMAAIRNLRETIDLAELEAQLAAGQIDDALELLIEAAQVTGYASSTVFILAGQDTARFLAEAGVARIGFNQANERAVAIMRDNQLSLIREFADEQRAATRIALTDGIERGVGPREQARNFRQSIGLTERQAQYVRNYRAALERVGQRGVPRGEQMAALQRRLRDGRADREIERAIRESTPLSKKRIEWMVGRYAERWIKFRSEMIARTESLRSVHQGTDEAYEQAIDAGQIARADIEQTWNSARDDRVRDSHRKLNGQKRRMGETWQGDYGELRYPGDPLAPAAETIQCRCIVTRRIRPA